METIISTIVIIACTYFFTRRKVKPIEQETDSGTQPEASADIQQEEKQDEPPHTKDLCIELVKQCKRLRVYTLPFIVKVLTFAP